MPNKNTVAGALRGLLVLAAFTLFISCGDKDLFGPPEPPPLLRSGGHAIIFTSDATGPLANLIGLSFDQLVDAYESVAEADTVVIGLPIQGLPPESPISIPRGFVEIDPDARTATFAGAAAFRGFNVVFLLIGVWEHGGSPADFALVIRVDAGSLGAIVPGVAGTVLADLAYRGASVVLSERVWVLPDAVPDALQQVAPGLATIRAGASFLGSFDPPETLARALELIPGIDGTLPSLEGGFGLDASTILADPGSVAVEALDGLELGGQIPSPSGAIGALRVLDHALSARWQGGGVALTLESEVRVEVDGGLPFAFTTAIDAHGSGAASLTGRMAEPWPQPFGLGWLSVDSVRLRVAGSASARELRLTATATAVDEFAATLTVDTDVPELSLRLSADLDFAALGRLVNGASGLTGDATIRLPAGGPTLRQVDLTLRPENDTPLVIAGMGTLLGNVEAGALLTLVRDGGTLHPLLSFRMGAGLIGALVPPLAGSTLDLAVAGGTFIAPVPDHVHLTIERESLAPAAREFFDAAWTGLSGYSIEVSPVLRLDAPIALSAVPEAVATVLGLDRSGNALLGGAVGVELGILAGSASVQLDSLAIEATVPLSGARTGLPGWLQPRSHAVAYRWNRAPETRHFSLRSDLVATLGGESVAVKLEADLETTQSSLSLHGHAGRLARPWGLHWLTVDSLAVRVEGDPARATVGMTADLRVAGVPAHLRIAAADDGDAVLSLSVEPELTLGSVAEVAGALGGVEAAVSVELPAGGPSLHGIAATVRPGSAVPFSLMGTGALRNGAIEVLALLTLVNGPSGLTPVLVLRTGNTSIGAIAPSVGGTPLDLGVPAMAITVPTPRGQISVPSGDLPPDLRDALGAIFGHGRNFDLRLESALRIDAPIPLGFVPEAVGRALALDLSGEAHLGGSLGIHLDGLTAGGAAVDSITLFAVVPRQGVPSFRPGWPEWLEPQRDSVELYWRRDPAVSRLSLQSSMRATLGGQSLPFRIETDITSDGDGDRVELRGRTGRWERPFGIDWLTMDTLGLRLVTSSASTTAELGSAVEVLGLEAGLDIAVHGGDAELDLTLKAVNTGHVATLLERQWPNLALPPNFPEVEFTNVFLYVRTGAVTGFSIGGDARFYDQDASALVSVAGTGGFPRVVAGFGLHDFGLPSLLRNAGVDVGEDAGHFMEVFTFEEAAILFSTTDVDVADSELDRHAKEFFRSVFGEGPFSMRVKSGLTAVARRPLPSGGPLETVIAVLAPENPDRSVTVSGRIPASYMGLPDATSSRLEFRLLLPAMAPSGSPEWFRSGRLSLELLGPPGPSVGIVGAMGVRVDDHDLDFEVATRLSAGGGGTLIFQGVAAAGQEWVDPFGTPGLTLRRLGLDLTLSATSAGICVGGDVTIGTQDVAGAMGLFLNTATGAPVGGVFYGKSDRGLALEDLVDLQSKMFENPPLPIGALPAMRVDTVEVLVAVPNPATLNLACVPEGVSGNLAVKGNLWAQITPTGDMDKLAGAEFRIGRQGITAKGEMVSGSVGPITWTDPRIDLEVNRVEQHFMIHGGARIGNTLVVDSLALHIARDSLAFATSMEVMGGIKAEIAAAAAPSLTSPSFLVHGMLEGAYVAQLSAELYRQLGQYSQAGHVLLDQVRSNASGFDLNAAIDAAERTAQLAQAHLDEAERTLRSLRTARAQCGGPICVARHDVKIATWERIRDVRSRRYDAAKRALDLLRRTESYAASLENGLKQLDDWLDNQRIVLTEAGFHTDLDHLLGGGGLEIYVNGMVDRTQLNVSLDLNADLARTVVKLAADILPAELSTLLDR